MSRRIGRIVDTGDALAGTESRDCLVLAILQKIIFVFIFIFIFTFTVVIVIGSDGDGHHPGGFVSRHQNMLPGLDLRLILDAMMARRHLTRWHFVLICHPGPVLHPPFAMIPSCPTACIFIFKGLCRQITRSEGTVVDIASEPLMLLDITPAVLLSLGVLSVHRGSKICQATLCSLKGYSWP